MTTRRIETIVLAVVVVCIAIGLVALAPDRRPHTRSRCDVGQTAVQYADGEVRCLP